MKKPTLGIQLYTLRDYIKTPEAFDNTLGRLEKMGVREVQISAIGDFSAEKQRDILEKHGMGVCITHKSLDRMENDLDALLKEYEIIGCYDIGLGWVGSEMRGSVANVEEFLKRTDAVGESMKKRGFSFYYHNHDFEFEKLCDADTTMMDTVLERSNPEHVGFIPDVAWIHYGGRDPVEILERMKGRVKVIHFKDYVTDEKGERSFVPLGEGVVDLKACYDAACRLEIPYIMYEHDDNWPENDPFKACEQSWAYMNRLASEPEPQPNTKA